MQVHLEKSVCGVQGSSEDPCRIYKVAQGSLPHMPHLFRKQDHILTDVKLEYILNSSQSHRKLTSPRTTQRFQGGISVLRTPWLPNHHSVCRRRFWAYEDLDRVPTRGGTSKYGHIKWTRPWHLEVYQGGEGMVQNYSPRTSFPVHSKAPDYSYIPQHGEDSKLLSGGGKNLIQSHPQDHHASRDLRLQKSPPSTSITLMSGSLGG